MLQCLDSRVVGGTGCDQRGLKPNDQWSQNILEYCMQSMECKQLGLIWCGLSAFDDYFEDQPKCPRWIEKLESIRKGIVA